MKAKNKVNLKSKIPNKPIAETPNRSIKNLETKDMSKRNTAKDLSLQKREDSNFSSEFNKKFSSSIRSPKIFNFSRDDRIFSISPYISIKHNVHDFYLGSEDGMEEYLAKKEEERRRKREEKRRKE